MSNSIKEIMRQVHSINKDKKFIDALTLMIKEKTNSLAVVDAKGKLVGLLNTGMLIKQVIPNYLEEDAIATHFASEDIFIEEIKKAKNSSIEDVMIKNPKSVHIGASLMEVALMALSSRQFRIPVVDSDNKLVGLITRTELKRFFGSILNVENN